MQKPHDHPLEVTPLPIPELTLTRGQLKFAPEGLEIDPDLNFDQWHSLLSIFPKFKAAFHSHLADVLEFGRNKFGEAIVAQTLAQLEFDQIDVKRATAISTLARSTRKPWLNSEHYWVMSQSKMEPEAQAFWASQVVQHRLSPVELRQSIEKGKVITPSLLPDKRSGIPTIHGWRQIFELWWKDVSDFIDDWPDDRKAHVLEELREPARLAIRLAKELGVEL